MRCASYCTAGLFTINKLVELLVTKGYEPKYYDDVVHIHREMGKTEPALDIFYFPFGCVTIWGGTEAIEASILNEITAFEQEKNPATAQDFIYYHYDDSAGKTYIDEEKNEIILHAESPFIKLSISHALAQSVKLNVLEASVTSLLEKTTPLQKELAATGKVSLSRQEISKKIGMLFNERYSINMHSDILDVPEFFWRRPSYEPLYLMTAAFQDIQVRQNIMNHRLDMINDLYSILSNELNYIHSTRLEIIIIVLIAIEVAIGLSHNDILARLTNLIGW